MSLMTRFLGTQAPSVVINVKRLSSTGLGTGTWVAPTGVTSVIVECIGNGDSGYGGDYAKKTLTVVPGTSYTYKTAYLTGGISWFISSATVSAGCTGNGYPLPVGTVTHIGGTGGLDGGGAAGPHGNGNAAPSPPTAGGDGDAGYGGLGGFDSNTSAGGNGQPGTQWTSTFDGTTFGSGGGGGSGPTTPGNGGNYGGSAGYETTNYNRGTDAPGTVILTYNT